MRVIQTLPGKQTGAGGGADRTILEGCARGITTLSIGTQDPLSRYYNRGRSLEILIYKVMFLSDMMTVR